MARKFLTDVDVTGNATISGTGSGTLAGSYSAPTGYRNLLHNGAFTIWQRGTSQTGWSGALAPRLLDRWAIYQPEVSLSSIVDVNKGQNSIVITNSSGSTNSPSLIQRLEAVDCWFTSGNSVTISGIFTAPNANTGTPSQAISVELYARGTGYVSVSNVNYPGNTTTKIYTSTPHGCVVGDTVTISGVYANPPGYSPTLSNTANGTYVVTSILSATGFVVATASNYNPLGAWTYSSGGSVTSSIPLDDGWTGAALQDSSRDDRSLVQSSFLPSSTSRQSVTFSVPSGYTGGLELVIKANNLTNSSTFTVKEVQMELGTVATPFERRSYATELKTCQRYCESFGSGAGGSIYSHIGWGLTTSAITAVNTTYFTAFPYKTTKRVEPPDVELDSTNLKLIAGSGTIGSGALAYYGRTAFSESTRNVLTLEWIYSASLTSGYQYGVRNNYILALSEL